MTKKNNIAKASLGYTIGNYFVRGLGFITVPVFSRLLSKSDFGIYNTFLAYEAIMTILIGLALNGSIKNAKKKFSSKIDQYTSSVMLIPIFVLCVFVLVWIFAKTWLSELLSIDSLSLLVLLIYSYASSLLNLYQTRISLDYKYSEYLRISLFNAVCSVILSVLLILLVFDDCRYYGRILGATITYLVIALYVFVRLFKNAKPSINKEYWKYGLKVSLPLIPHGLAQILLLSSDKIMINSIIGSIESGIYSFAYTVYSLVQITATSLDTVYSTWVFQQNHDERGRTDIKRIGTCFMVLIGGICTIVILFAPELIMILGGEKYRDAIYCTIPVVFAGFFAMSYCIPAVMEYYYEKTQYISMGTVIAAILNIALNWVLIPRYGYIAAAYTTVFGYAVYFGLHIAISRKLCGYFVIMPKFLVIVIVLLITAFFLGLKNVDSIIIRSLIAFVMFGFDVTLLCFAYGRHNVMQIFKKFAAGRIKNESR